MSLPCGPLVRASGPYMDPLACRSYGRLRLHYFNLAHILLLSVSVLKPFCPSEIDCCEAASSLESYITCVTNSVFFFFFFFILVCHHGTETLL